MSVSLRQISLFDGLGLLVRGIQLRHTSSHCAPVIAAFCGCCCSCCRCRCCGPADAVLWRLLMLVLAHTIPVSQFVCVRVGPARATGSTLRDKGVEENKIRMIMPKQLQLRQFRQRSVLAILEAEYGADWAPFTNVAEVYGYRGNATPEVHTTSRGCKLGTAMCNCPPVSTS